MSSKYDIQIPQSFKDMPRWRNASQQDQLWLEGLPRTISVQCRYWALQLDGPVLHGSNAVVLPVSQAGLAFVLRLTPPGNAFAGEAIALGFWNGRGTVQLADADVEAGAMLLERLDISTSLADIPLFQAAPIAAQLMRRLAVSVSDTERVTSTSDIVSKRVKQFPESWSRLGKPFDHDILKQVIHLSACLQINVGDLAVNGDFHYGQILPGIREPWLAVDPILLRGDIEYDLARLIWTRLDETPSDEEVISHFETFVRVAKLDRSRAWRWVLFRTMDYWLWCLESGLTEDPVRCERLLNIFIKDYSLGTIEKR